MAENPDRPSGSLALLRIICGLPLIASPIVIYGGIFMLLAHGASMFQKLYTVAVMAYPVVYLVTVTTPSDRGLIYTFYYLIALLGLWPVLGPA